MRYFAQRPERNQRVASKRDPFGGVKMNIPVIQGPEPMVASAKPQVDRQQRASLSLGAEKRADAARANKKKRDAHRVSLRRSHTNG